MCSAPSRNAVELRDTFKSETLRIAEGYIRENSRSWSGFATAEMVENNEELPARLAGNRDQYRALHIRLDIS